MVATGTAWTVLIDDDVAHLTNHAGRSSVEVSIQDERRANTISDGEKEQIGNAGGRTLVRFCQCRCSRDILDEYRQAKLCGYPVRERNRGRTECRLGTVNPAARVHESGEGDADGPNALARETRVSYNRAGDLGNN